MSGNTIGITIIVVIRVLLLFQVIYQGIRQERRHTEILKRIEEIGKTIDGNKA